MLTGNPSKTFNDFFQDYSREIIKLYLSWHCSQNDIKNMNQGTITFLVALKYTKYTYIAVYININMSLILYAWRKFQCN